MGMIDDLLDESIQEPVRGQRTKDDDDDNEANTASTLIFFNFFKNNISTIPFTMANQNLSLF